MRLLRDLPDDRRAAKSGVLQAGRTKGLGPKFALPESDKDVTEGRVSLMPFTAGVYPGCSQHGAMNALTLSIWRCSECGVGGEWLPEAS